MILANVDEAAQAEIHPTTVLTEKDLLLAKVQQVEPGTEFTLTCRAKAVEVNEATAENGLPESTVVLELSRISLEGDEPKQPATQTVEQRFYNRSGMA